MSSTVEILDDDEQKTLEEPVVELKFETVTETNEELCGWFVGFVLPTCCWS